MKQTLVACALVLCVSTLFAFYQNSPSSQKTSIARRRVAAGECYFPRGWRGCWFQAGLGDVTIQEASFSGKGLCLDQRGDYYYLIQNRDLGCQQCILVMPRHHNLLQYKESYCIGRDTLHNICLSIRVEAILYTLVREPAIAVAAPFLDTYHFVYSNNSGGLCVDPANYVQQCASPAQFRFHFEACDPLYVAYTRTQDLELSVLATWKDGSDRYMYGAFSGPQVISKDQTYRCFMYRVLGTVVYLSMSADATCRGLRSDRDGPLTMELTRDTLGWPPPGCSFPEWFTRTTWRDLSGRHVYASDAFGEVLTLTSRRLRGDRLGEVRFSFRCLHRAAARHAPATHVTVLSFTVDHCDTKRQCLQIIKRRDNVIEIQTGAYIPEAAHVDRCSDAHLGAFRSKRVLIPEYHDPVACPFSGQFFVHREPRCVTDLRSGCHRPSHIQITSSCDTQPVARLECVETWEEHGRQYVIVRDAASHRAPANCFSFAHLGDVVEFAADPQCNLGAPQVMPCVAYRFPAHPAPCSRLLETASKSGIRSRDSGGRPGESSAATGEAEGYKLSPAAGGIVVDNVQPLDDGQSSPPGSGQLNPDNQKQSLSARSSGGQTMNHSTGTISHLVVTLLTLFLVVMSLR